MRKSNNLIDDIMINVIKDFDEIAVQNTKVCMYAHTNRTNMFRVKKSDIDGRENTRRQKNKKF